MKSNGDGDTEHRICPVCGHHPWTKTILDYLTEHDKISNEDLQEPLTEKSPLLPTAPKDE